MTTKRALSGPFVTVCVSLAFSFTAHAANLTVGYQTGIDPSKVPQSDGLYEKTIGQKIDWRRFNSGPEVVTAIASGNVQIGNLGSSPLAAAASRKFADCRFHRFCADQCRRSLVGHNNSWTADSVPVHKIAKLTGANATDVPELLAGSTFPDAKAQQTAALLETAKFLKEQGKVETVLPDYSPYVSAKFVLE